MKKLNLYLLLIILANYAYSQDCPQYTGSWQNNQADYGYDSYGNYGTVNYNYYSAGGDYNIKINWSTLVTDSGFLSDSTIMKFLEIKAIEASVPRIKGYNCKARVYFEKSCQAKIRSIIKVDQSSEVCCAEGMNSSNYVYSRVINGVLHKFVDVYQYLNCGTKCCYREYDVTVGYDDLYEIYYYSISEPITYSVNTCNPISAYTDCLDPNIPVPCISSDCDDE